MDELSWSWSPEKHIEVQEEKEHFVVAFLWLPVHTTWNMHFYVVVVQCWQRNVPKNFDACLKLVVCIFNLLNFWRSCCCRRRRIFDVPESYLRSDTMNSPIKYQRLSCCSWRFPLLLKKLIVNLTFVRQILIRPAKNSHLVGDTSFLTRKIIFRSAQAS